MEKIRRITPVKVDPTKEELKKALTLLEESHRALISNATKDKGDKGEPGKDGVSIRGEKGDKGDKGDPGDPGKVGAPGKDGVSIRGDKGDKGDKGDPGKRGLRGFKGNPGKDGKDFKVETLKDIEIARLQDKIIGKVVKDVSVQDNQDKATIIIEYTTGKSSKLEILKPKPNKTPMRIGGAVTNIQQGSTLENQIIVREASDFGTIDSSKEYFIDGIVDLGSLELDVPSGGMTIKGYNFDQSQLVSSADNYTMFKSTTGAGNILGTDVAFEVSGTNSKLYGLAGFTGLEAVEMNRVNFNNCTSLGYLDNFRQGLESGTGRFGGTPELEFRGTWIGGYRIDTSIVRSISNMTSLFKAGAGFVYSGRFLIGINCDLPATGALIDFAKTNIANNESLILRDAFVTRQGVIDASDTTIYPNIDHTATESLWTDNTGLPNTTKYIKGTCTTEVTTVISAVDTYYPLLGTISIDTASHFDSPSNGEYRLRSGNGTYQFSGDLVLDGGSNNVLDLRVTKSTDGGVTWPTQINHIRRQVNALVGGRDVAFFPINFIATLNVDDRIRLEVENKTNQTNITQELDSYFIVTSIQ